jgi:hypothetical protein
MEEFIMSIKNTVAWIISASKMAFASNGRVLPHQHLYGFARKPLATWESVVAGFAQRRPSGSETMHLQIDLFGCKDARDVLLRFGEVLEFGGPKRNVDYVPGQRGGWTLTWTGFDECWGEIELGGIWGDSEKITFPVTVHLHHTEAFAKASIKDYEMMTAILNNHVTEYAKEGKQLEVQIHKVPNSLSVGG